MLLATHMTSSSGSNGSSNGAASSSVFHLAITPDAYPLNARSGTIMQSHSNSGDPSDAPYTTLGLTGEGQVVAVADTGT